MITFNKEKLEALNNLALYAGDKHSIEIIEGFEIIMRIEENMRFIHDALKDKDFTEKHKIDLLQKIDEDEIFYFSVNIQVKKADLILGNEYRGECFYKSAADFVTSGCYEQMRNKAIEEAKNKLKELAL